ncbi:MAG: hypothetical protein ACYCW6_04640, partial [Candidatus Xenobia bacterium]
MRTLVLMVVLLLVGQAVSGAGGPRRTAQALDRMNAEFCRLRPDAKKAFLERMQRSTPDLKRQWDAYIADKQAAFAAAHPPVAPLSADAERSIRSE